MKKTLFLLLILCSIGFVAQARPDSSKPERIVAQESGASERMDIREFVHQIFFEGVPYAETLEAYDASVVPTLLEMLNNPREEPYWANIVVVLNIVGDESVLEPLIEFIEGRAEGKLSEDHYRAKTAAIMAMGYLINRTGSEKALNYLIESLNPAIWRERGTTGYAPFQRSEAESNNDFSKYAILGLAMSGHPKSTEILKALEEPDEARELGINERFQLEIKDMVAEAQRANELIARIGLIAYYEQANDDDDEREEKDTEKDDDREEEITGEDK